MLKTLSNSNKITRSIVNIFLKSVSFACILVLSTSLIFFMSRQISAKKSEVNDKKARELQIKTTPISVVALEVMPSQLKEVMTLPGVAAPWIAIEVMSQVKGVAVKKIVESGHQVKKGDLLALIDQRDYRNAFASAKSVYDSAFKTERRVAALAKKQFVTQSQVDEAVTRLNTCRSDMDNAKLNLERCRITSPMDGVVDRVFFESGQLINPGECVAKIIQIDKLKIEVGIPESDVDAVRRVKKVRVIIDALDGKSYTGTCHYLHKTSDSNARLYKLEIRVDNPDLRILPQMFARVEIIKQQVDQGLAVPIYSLVKKDSTQGVYVEKNGRVHFREVSTGLKDNFRVHIPNGLNPGENVVIAGHRFIKDGDLVDVEQHFNDIEALTL